VTQSYPVTSPMPIHDNSSSSFQHTTPPIGQFARGPSGDLYTHPIAVQTTQNQSIITQNQPVNQPILNQQPEGEQQRLITNRPADIPKVQNEGTLDNNDIPLQRTGSASMLPHHKVIEINLPCKSNFAPGNTTNSSTVTDDNLSPALAEVVQLPMSTTNINTQETTWNTDYSFRNRPEMVSTVVVDNEKRLSSSKLPQDRSLLEKQNQTLQQEQTTQRQTTYVAGA